MTYKSNSGANRTAPVVSRGCNFGTERRLRSIYRITLPAALSSTFTIHRVTTEGEGLELEALRRRERSERLLPKSRAKPRDLLLATRPFRRRRPVPTGNTLQTPSACEDCTG